MRLYLIILLGLCGCASVGGRATAPSESPLTEAQERELGTLTRMLTETDRAPRTRYEAAQLLLTRPYLAADQALITVLAERTNRPARIAAAQAIADTGATDEAFVAPLFAMLGEEDPEVRSAAAAALGAYRDPDVLTKLASLARDEQTAEPTRLAAIAGLARRIDKLSIETLIHLLADPQPAVRPAALASLQKLTGINRFGPDQRQWRSWWWANRGKPRQQWMRPNSAE